MYCHEPLGGLSENGKQTVPCTDGPRNLYRGCARQTGYQKLHYFKEGFICFLLAYAGIYWPGTF